MITTARAVATGGILLTTAILCWLWLAPIAAPPGPPPPGRQKSAIFRLGLIPDRNLYDQRKAYRALGDYLETHVHVSRGASTIADNPPLHIELVTSSNYEGILRDFTGGDVDGAFLGSLVAALAIDRCRAQVLLKSENQAGQNTYAGVIFVPQSSPAHTLADLAGKKMAAVRTTTAGAIFPVYAYQQAGLQSALPAVIWSGTHDDAIEEVAAGRADAGAVKDLRLDLYEHAHPGVSFRRLSTGPRVPDGAFVVDRRLSPDVRDAIVATLLHMNDNPDAKPVLDKMSLSRFVPCEASEYAPLYDMIETLGPNWPAAGVEGSPPRRPGVK